MENPSNLDGLPKRLVVGNPQDQEPIPAQETALTVRRVPGILVVDDDVGMRALLNSILWEEGFAVWLAGDGKQAVELYEQLEGNIDLVLLDVHMPGMNGPQTLAQLQLLRPDVPCCFMSADIWSWAEEELLELGAMQVIPKSLRFRELVRVLRDLIAITTRLGNSAAGADEFRREASERFFG